MSLHDFFVQVDGQDLEVPEISCHDRLLQRTVQQFVECPCTASAFLSDTSIGDIKNALFYEAQNSGL